MKMIMPPFLLVSYNFPTNLDKNIEFYALILVSLHGYNNIRKLQYEIIGEEIWGLYQQLQTISSPLLSEVHFQYYIYQEEHLKLWYDIDNLMVQSFPSLSVVTIEWIEDESIAWVECVSRSVKFLPKLHQKGLLHTILPRLDRFL